MYLSVFNWPEEGLLTVPGLKNKVISAKLLSTGAKVKTASTTDCLNISLPLTTTDAIASVIKLEVKGKVEKIAAKDPKKHIQSGAID